MNDKQKWFLIAALWLALLFAVFAFYWFQVRPVNIRKTCARKANEATQAVKPGAGTSMHEVYRALYSDCCRNNGLKD